MLWKIFLSLAISLNFIACGNKEIQQWQGKIYSYQANDLAFERKQENEIISYNAPELKTTKQMLCMTVEDLNSFLQTYVVNPPKCQ